MDSKILKYFKKNHIQIEDIKYLTRVDGKTCIHTIDNQTSFESGDGFLYPQVQG